MRIFGCVESGQICCPIVPGAIPISVNPSPACFEGGNVSKGPNGGRCTGGYATGADDNCEEDIEAAYKKCKNYSK